MQPCSRFLRPLILIGLLCAHADLIWAQAGGKPAGPQKSPQKSPIVELHDRLDATLDKAAKEMESERARVSSFVGKGLTFNIDNSYKPTDWLTCVTPELTARAFVTPGFDGDISALRKKLDADYGSWQQKKLTDTQMLADFYDAAIRTCCGVYRANLTRLETDVFGAETGYQYAHIVYEMVLSPEYAKLGTPDFNVHAKAYHAKYEQLILGLYHDMIPRVHAVHDRLDRARKRWGPELWKYYDFADAKKVTATDGHTKALRDIRLALDLTFGTRPKKPTAGPLLPSGSQPYASGSQGPVLMAMVPGTNNAEDIRIEGISDPAIEWIDEDLARLTKSNRHAGVLNAGFGLEPEVDKLRGYKDQPIQWALWDTRVVPASTFRALGITSSNISPASDKPNTYTLIVYGPKLPAKRAELADLMPGLDLDNGNVKYTPISFLEDWQRMSQPGAQLTAAERQTYSTWSRAWDLVGRGLNAAGVDRVRNGSVALLIKAEVGSRMLPGPKTFLLNGIVGTWYLDQGTTEAKIRFVRELPPDEAAPGVSHFEPVSRLYLPSRFHVEVEAAEPVRLANVPVSLTRNAVPAFADGSEALIARQVQGERTLYRSQAIQLVDEDDGRLTDDGAKQRDKGVLYLGAREYQGLVAEIADPGLFRLSAGSAATAPVRASAEALWSNALKTAAALDGQDPGDWSRVSRQTAETIAHASFTNVMFRVLGTAEKVLDPTGKMTTDRRILSAFLLGEPDPGKGTLISKAEVKVGDHAAMILLRRQFIKDMEAYEKQLPQLQGPEMVTGFRRLIEPQMVNESSALARIMVPAPIRLGSGIGGTFDILQPVEVPLACAFNKTFLDSRFAATQSSARENWINSSVRIGLERFKKAISRSLTRARNTRESDVKGLIELTGNGFKPVVDELVPDLMTPVKDASGATISWAPDREGRSWLKSYSDTIDNVRAQAAESDLDTEVAMTVASLIPIALPESLAKTLLSLAVNVGFAVKGAADVAKIDAHGGDEIDFALGAAAVLGTARLDMAVVQRTSIWPAVLNFALCGLGVTADTTAAMAALSEREVARELPVILQRLPDGAPERLLNLPPRDQAVFFDGAARAERVVGIRGPDQLSKLDQDVLARYKRLIEATKKARNVDGTLVLPEFEPGTARLNDPAFGVRDLTYVTPPPLGRNERARMGLPVPENYRWTAPQDGASYPLGDRIGEPSANAAVVKIEGTDEVIKFVPYREGQALPRVPGQMQRTEEMGTTMFFVAAKQKVLDAERAQNILDRLNILQARITKFISEGDLPYMTQKFLRQVEGDADGCLMLATNPQAYQLAADGVTRTAVLKEPLQRALLKAWKRIGKGNAVYTDGHRGNWYFQKVNGEWQAGVLDQDRICMWGDLTPAVNEELDIVEKLCPHVHSMQTSSRGMGTGRCFADSDIAMEKLLEYKGWIEFDSVTKQFTDRHLSVSIVKEFYPEMELHVGLRAEDMRAGIPPAPRNP